VRLTVYETGRDLLSMGVIPLEDMLSEVALVKSMWVIGNGLDLKATMPKNLRGEISERREAL
jgi:glutamyl-tRNA(Gln) amidotransferase subunit D (EC 6.3.5.7)